MILILYGMTAVFSADPSLAAHYALAVAAPAGAVRIVDEGRSDYQVVLPGAAIPAERFAAEELVVHLEKMTGAKLPIVDETDALPAHAILLGPSRHLKGLGVEVDWDKLGKEEHLIRAVGDRLVIAGGRPRGVLYGVYALLEDQLGCRWYAPDTGFVPKRKTIGLGRLNVTGRPAFEYRDPKMYAGGRRSLWWRRHFDPKYVARTRNSATFIHDHVHPIDPRHGDRFRIPHFGHNLSWLVPGKLHAKEHPEYFALHKGKRVTQGDLELCLAHPDVARVAADTLREAMRQDPDPDMLFIGQSDTGKFCMCARCMAAYEAYGPVKPDKRHGGSFGLGYGGLAGRNLQFVSRVADLLQGDFPDQRIGAFAYGATRNPPRNIAKAHRNVVIWYCPLERCVCHPIDRGPINAHFYGFARGIRRWVQIAGDVYLYDYWLGGALGLPADLLTIAETVRAAHRLGVKGIEVDTIGDIQAGFGFCRYWLWTQLLRDPDFDAEWGLREFLDAYYGDAAVHIDRFIRLVSNPRMYEPLPTERANIWTSEESPVREQLVYGCHLGHRQLRVEALEDAHALFERALEATTADPKSHRHVEAARMVLQHAMLERLPGGDPRLEAEAANLLRMAKELEMPTIQRTPLQQYRERIGKKIGGAIPAQTRPATSRP